MPVPRKIVPPADLAPVLSALSAAARRDGRADDVPLKVRLPAGADLGDVRPGSYTLNEDGTLTPRVP